MLASKVDHAVIPSLKSHVSRAISLKSSSPTTDYLSLKISTRRLTTFGLTIIMSFDKLAKEIEFVMNVLVHSSSLDTDWKRVCKDLGSSNPNNT